MMIFSSGPGADFQARYEVMLDVTLETLRSDPDLKLCEGLRLIEATRTAVARHAPANLDVFDTQVMPRLNEALMGRFGVVNRPEYDIQ